MLCKNIQTTSLNLTEAILMIVYLCSSDLYCKYEYVRARDKSSRIKLSYHNK